MGRWACHVLSGAGSVVRGMHTQARREGEGVYASLPEHRPMSKTPARGPESGATSQTICGSPGRSRGRGSNRDHRKSDAEGHCGPSRLGQDTVHGGGMSQGATTGAGKCTHMARVFSTGYGGQSETHQTKHQTEIRDPKFQRSRERPCAQRHAPRSESAPRGSRR